MLGLKWICAAALLGLIGAAGCDSTLAGAGGANGDRPDGEGTDLCIGNHTACGSECGETSDCPEGLFCSAGGCQRECVPGESAVSYCSDGSCNDDGSCVGESLGSRDARKTELGECIDTVVDNSRVTPNVILIVDQSASMDEGFGGQGSRWDVMRDFLLDQDSGLIAGLQDEIRFGLALYSGEDNNPTCPLLTTVEPSLDNLAELTSVYRGEDTIEDTPTGDAINGVRDWLSAGAAPDTTDPTIFIVATDGAPDRCEELDPNPTDGAITEAEDAVAGAFSDGIRSFMIWIGELNDPELESHMQRMANLGVGSLSGSDADYWIAGDDASLQSALRGIVGGQATCDVWLSGVVEASDACLGTVSLQGEPLKCDDPDGWTLVNSSMIRLQGSACDSLMALGEDASMEVRFPCFANVTTPQ